MDLHMLRRWNIYDRQLRAATIGVALVLKYELDIASSTIVASYDPSSDIRA